MNSFHEVLYPEDFHLQKIRIHSACEAELKELIEKSGHEAMFKAHFRKRLSFLQEKWEKAVEHRNWFELLKGEGLYSLRLVNINNIRILYVLRKKHAFLLCAFKKKGKKPGEDSYAHYTPIARSRMSDIKEE